MGTVIGLECVSYDIFKYKNIHCVTLEKLQYLLIVRKVKRMYIIFLLVVESNTLTRERVTSHYVSYRICVSCI